MGIGVIYCFDIDGTICETDGMDYENAKPIPWMVQAINHLYNNGHEIKYYTARGMSGGKRSLEWARVLTARQLLEWGLPHGTLYPKPYADVYVDDRLVPPDKFKVEWQA